MPQYHLALVTVLAGTCVPLLAATVAPKLTTTDISAGQTHALALRSDGTAWTWGTNRTGEMGLSNLLQAASPRRIPGLSNITGLSAAPLHSLAVAASGQVWAWGTNGDGRLGNGTFNNTTVPVLVAGLTNAVQVSSAGQHSLAVLLDGRVLAWGANDAGQLGTGTTQGTNQPVLVVGLTNAIAVSGGSNYSLALTKTGEVFSWGDNNCGQLGLPTNYTRVPARISGLSNITQIAAGGHHGLAMDNGGRVFAWGHNNSGQLGTGTTADSSVPLLVSNLRPCRWISASCDHSVSVGTDGTLLIWGASPFSSPLTRPSLLGVGQQFTRVSQGSQFLLACKADGSVWAWGTNHVGQWGNGTTLVEASDEYARMTPTLSFSPFPYPEMGRFNRGNGTNLAQVSFLLTLDLEKGVRQTSQGSEAFCYGLGVPWFLRVTNAPCLHAYQLTSNTTELTRFPVENPIACFGSAGGGSALYTGQGYRFGVFAGAFDENSPETNIFRVSVYSKAAFNGNATNVAPTNVFQIAMPRRSVRTDSNVWQDFVNNGFKIMVETNGLRTIVEFVDGVSNRKPWGLSWLGNPQQPLVVSNVVLAAYRVTHCASSADYCYRVEVLGAIQTGANTMAPLATSSNGTWVPLPVYTLDFETLPPWRSTFIDRPHFEGIPVPSAYAGRTDEERNGLTAQLTTTFWLTNSAIFTNSAEFKKLGTSAELLPHPLLDQFVEDMGRDPLALATYVVNEIELTDPLAAAERSQVVPDAVNLGGINRSALATFLEGQGSPTEQCALLIYLLRQAGYPAGYVWPTANNLRLLDTRLSKLWQIQVKGVVYSNDVPVITNGLIVVNYPWVVANIGTNCVQIFPWLKDTEIVEGPNLYDCLPTNYSTAYSWIKAYSLAKSEILDLAPGANLPLTLWPLFVEAALRTNHIDSRLSLDSIGVRAFNRRNQYPTWQHLPLPNFLTNQTQVTIIPTLSEDTNAYPFLKNIFDLTRVEVYRQDTSTNNLLFSSGDWYACNLHNRKMLLFNDTPTNLTLWLAPYCPGSAHQEAFAGPSSTNPQVALAVVQPNDLLWVRVIHQRKKAGLSTPYTYFPEGEGFSSIGEMSCRLGDVAAICTSVGRVTPRMLRPHAEDYWRLERERASNANYKPSVNDNQGTAAMLLGMGYYERLSRFETLNQRLHKIRGLTLFTCGLAVVGAVPQPGKMQAKVDMQGRIAAWIGNASLRPDTGEEIDASLENYALHAIANGSAQEHDIINGTLGEKNAISTVRLLQLAAEHARTNGWAAPPELNSRNYLSLGGQTFTGYGNNTLQNQDPGIWQAVTNVFQGSQGDYARVLITPGSLANETGTYKGVGALILLNGSWTAAISANQAILNGGWGSQVASLVPPTTPTYKMTYDLTTIAGAYQFNLNDFDTPTPLPVISALAAATLTVGEGLVNNIAWSPNQADQSLMISHTLNMPSGAGMPETIQHGFNSGLFGAMEAGFKQALATVFDPVDVVSGGFYVDTVDLTLPGPLPLQLRRNYLSRNLTGNQFGFGWKLNFTPWLVLSTNSSGISLIYAAEMDGAVIAYRWKTNNLWVVQPEDNPTLNNHMTTGVGATANLFNSRIERFTDDGVTYLLTPPDGTRRYYQELTCFGIAPGANQLPRVRPYLTSWQDHVANYHLFSYGTNADANDYGQLNRIDSANGNFLVFKYDFFGRIVEAFAGDGRRFQYEYDNYGDLVRVQLPDASEWNYEYQHYTFTNNNRIYTDSNHLLVKETKPNGRLLQNTYDSLRRVTTQASTVGSNLVLVTNAWFAYSNNGTSLTNEVFTGATCVEDVFHRQTYYYYTNNLIMRIVDPLGNVTTQDWFETNETNNYGYYFRSLQATVEPRGLKQQFIYDAFGNLTTNILTGDLTGEGLTNETATYVWTYTDYNMPAQATDPAGNSTTFTYHYGFPFLLTSIMRSAGNTNWATNYFAYTEVYQDLTDPPRNLYVNGLCRREWREGGAVIERKFDGRGFRTQEVRYAATLDNPNNSDPPVTNFFAYNARGELYEQWDASGRRSRRDFDAMGRIKWRDVTDESGTTLARETFYYNRNGELEWYDGPRSNPDDLVWYDYDGAGRKTQEIHWRTRAKTDGSGVEAEEGDDLYATTFYAFDAFGNLTKVTGPGGVVTTNAFDALGRPVLKQVFDSNGSLLTSESCSYEPGGKVAFQTNALQGWFETRYTSTGQPKYQRNADGSTNAWRYWSDGRLRREIQRNGAYWETTFDDANRITRRTFYSADGTPLATTSSRLDARGNVLQTVDALGNVFTNAYDGLDRLKLAAGPAVTNVATTGANPTSLATNFSQHLTTYSYDTSDRVLTVADALGNKTVTTSDALGRPTAVQVYDTNNALVRVTSTDYALDHQSRTVTQGSGDAALVSTTFTDTEDHPVVTVGSPAPGVSEYTLNRFDVAGNQTESRRYAKTNSQSTLYTLSTWTYDGLHRVLTENARDGAVTSFAYDQAGNLTNRLMSGVLQWQAHYNQAGQKTDEKNVGSDGSATRTNSYAYYSSGDKWAGLPQTATDGRGVVCTFGYDDWLRPATNTYTGSLDEHKLTTTWAYDLRGLTTSITERFTTNSAGFSNAIQRTFDAYGQLKNETVSMLGTNFSTATQGWDVAGRRSSLILQSQNYGYAWLADGQLGAVAGPPGSATYGYNMAGWLTNRTVGSRVTGILARDGLGRPTLVTNTVGGAKALGETLTWTGDGLLAAHTLDRADFTDARFYTYADLSRRLGQEQLNLDASKRWTNTFAYDSGTTGGLGVLTQAGTPASSGADWQAGKDAFSRIQAETNKVLRRTAYGNINGPAWVTATLDARPVTVTRIGTNEMQWRALLEVTPGPHQLAVSATLPTGQYSTNAFSSFTNANTAGDTISNVFDAAGLLTQRVWRSNGQSNRVQNLSWDGKGRLCRLTERDATNSGFNWSAIYDPLGRRLQTTTVVVTNGIAQSSQPSIINQSYDPLVEFLELGLSADGTNAWKLYGPDLSGAYGGMQGVGGLEAVKQDGDLSGPVVADARGNVLGVYDTSKGMTWLASRTTGYGAVPGYRPASFAAGISLSYASGWRGRWADVSGLYCLGARYYDPVAGRFLGADPLGHGGDPSLYGFCGGDPINRFDPDGRYGKNYVLNQVAEGMGLAHGLGDFGTDVLGLAEMANPQSVAMNLLNGRGLTPAADQARDWLQDRFDPIVSAMTSEQGSHYASGWFAGNLLPNLIPFAGLEEGGTKVAGGLMESAVQKFPSLGQDVGAAVSRWVGLDAAETAPKLLPAPSGYNPWIGEIRSVVAGTDTVMYRVWGGESGQVAGWLSPTRPPSTLSSIRDLALPPGNTAEYVSQVLVPAGSRYQIGTAASAFGQPGGGAQVLLLDRIPAANFGPATPLAPWLRP